MNGAPETVDNNSRRTGAFETCVIPNAFLTVRLLCDPKRHRVQVADCLLSGAQCVRDDQIRVVIGFRRDSHLPSQAPGAEVVNGLLAALDALQ